MTKARSYSSLLRVEHSYFLKSSPSFLFTFKHEFKLYHSAAATKLHFRACVSFSSDNL